MTTEANKGLTFDDRTQTWKTHAEQGAAVRTVPDIIGYLYSGRKFRAAMSLWYVWEWIIQEFTEEWSKGRRAF